MRITALSGGVGGARFLAGLVHHLASRSPGGAEEGPHELVVVGNTADDITLHGLRVCPDLDTVMYTLGGGVHPEQGWGRVDETMGVAAELAAYGAGPDWFTLGDKDLATHLVRSQMLGLGYPLSQVTAALCARWDLAASGVRLLPMTDDPVETHVVVDDEEAEGGQRAIHFQEWWVRHHAALPARRIVAVGAEQSSPAPGVLDALREADVVLRPAEQPGRVDRHDPVRPRRPRRPARHPGAGRRPLAHRGRQAGARHGRRLPGGDRRAQHRPRGRRPVRRPARRVAGRHLRRRPRRHDRPGRTGARARPSAAHDRPRRDGRDGRRRGRPRPRPRGGDAGTRVSVTAVAVPGLGEVRAGDDLAALVAAALAAAGLVLRDDDVVVVASKVVAKAEGRTVPAATREREIDDASVAEVASRRLPDGRRTRVVRTHLGPVLAAAGVDASDVPDGTVLLLPADPDASARALRARLGELTGARPAVLVTDTAGRPWREGVADFALGAAGLAVLDDARGRLDAHGRALEVTVRNVGDQVAALGDLVKGKALGTPVAVVSGLGAAVVPDDGPGAAVLARGPRGDWFRHGHVEAVWHALGLAAGTDEVPAIDPGAEGRPQRLARALRIAVHDRLDVQAVVEPDGVRLTGSPVDVGRAAERLAAALWAEDVPVTGTTTDGTADAASVVVHLG